MELPPTIKSVCDHVGCKPLNYWSDTQTWFALEVEHKTFVKELELLFERQKDIWIDVTELSDGHYIIKCEYIMAISRSFQQDKV